jgi:hypothetical protein
VRLRVYGLVLSFVRFGSCLDTSIMMYHITIAISISDNSFDFNEFFPI